MVVDLKAPLKQAIYTVTPTMAHSWAICGGFFEASRGRSEERAASHALNLGTAVHELLVAFDRVRAPNAEAIETLVRRNWRPGRFSAPDDARAREEATRMLALYRARRGTEQVEVLVSECFVRTKPRGIGDGLLVVLSGRIDRLARRPDGALEVLDFKTTAALPSQEELRSDPATTAYHLLAAERCGANRIVIAQWSLRSDVRIEVELSPDDVAAGKARLRSMVREMASGTFSRTPGIACGYCPARLTCPALVHKVVSDAGTVWA